MKVIDLIEILKDYNSEAIVQIAVSDHAQVINLQDIGLDEEYEKDDALALTVCIEESEDLYFEKG